MMTKQDSLDPDDPRFRFSTFNDFANHFDYVAREREREKERETERERERREI